MPKFQLRLGNVFDSKCDLAVLPCSTIGTISKFTEDSVSRYNLPKPRPLMLGQVQLEKLPSDHSRAKYLAWGASVRDNTSTEADIESIGRHIGNIAAERPDIQKIHLPLFGIGAGRLKPELALSALKGGIEGRAPQDVTVVIFSPDEDTLLPLASRFGLEFLKPITESNELSFTVEEGVQAGLIDEWSKTSKSAKVRKQLSEIRYPREFTEQERAMLLTTFNSYCQAIIQAVTEAKWDKNLFQSSYTAISDFEKLGLILPDWFNRFRTISEQAAFVAQRLGNPLNPPTEGNIAHFLMDEFRPAFLQVGMTGQITLRLPSASSATGATTTTATTTPIGSAAESQTGHITIRTNRFNPITTLSNQLPSITNDGVDGAAYIDITADVDSMARLVCMKSVTPPLSIALFGNWGSGKSFFMRNVQKRVNSITTDPQSGNNKSPFFRQIVQIEFNAWHYVEADLWASLVSHIFDNLRPASEKDKDKWEEKRDALLKKLGATKIAKEKALRDLSEARAKESDAQRKLIIAQNDAQSKELALQRVEMIDILEATNIPAELKKRTDEIQAILGLHYTINSIRDVQSAIREAREIGGRFSQFVRALLKAPGAPKRLSYLTLSIAAPLVIIVIIQLVTFFSKQPVWLTANSWIVTTLGFLMPLIKPFLETLRNIDKARAQLSQLNTEFEKLVERKKAEKEDCVEAAKGNAKLAAAEVQAALNAVEIADAAVSAAERDLHDNSPGRMLNAFIEERSASDDYRKKLGMLALIQRDFKELSRLMKNANADEIAESKLPKIDRIILYIDDLDRCPPKQVVEVLQAIHLLLAFELFIVIVGVDPRWVSHSLRTQYPKLLQNDGFGDGSIENLRRPPDEETSTHLEGKARPLDYLEKIFQIPFWINPINKSDLAKLIDGHAKSSLLSELGFTQSTDEASVDKMQEKGTPSKSETLDPSRSDEVEILLPESSETFSFLDSVLTPDEVAFMKELTYLNRATPRAVKRYINIYRLLRTRVPKERIPDFLGKSGSPREYEVVMLLIDIYNGRPQAARMLIRAFQKDVTEEEAPDVPALHLLRQLEANEKSNTLDKEILDILNAYCAQFEGRLIQPTVETFYRWNLIVSRYSFCGELMS